MPAWRARTREARPIQRSGRGHRRHTILCKGRAHRPPTIPRDHQPHPLRVTMTSSWRAPAFTTMAAPRLRGVAPVAYFADRLPPHCGPFLARATVAKSIWRQRSGENQRTPMPARPHHLAAVPNISCAWRLWDRAPPSRQFADLCAAASCSGRPGKPGCRNDRQRHLSKIEQAQQFSSKPDQTLRVSLSRA